MHLISQLLCFIGRTLAWDRHAHVVVLNRLMGSQPSLDNWISNSITDISKQFKEWADWLQQDNKLHILYDENK